MRLLTIFDISPNRYLSDLFFDTPDIDSDIDPDLAPDFTSDQLEFHKFRKNTQHENAQQPRLLPRKNGAKCNYDPPPLYRPQRLVIFSCDVMTWLGLHDIERYFTRQALIDQSEGRDFLSLYINQTTRNKLIAMYLCYYLSSVFRRLQIWVILITNKYIFHRIIKSRCDFIKIRFNKRRDYLWRVLFAYFSIFSMLRLIFLNVPTKRNEYAERYRFVFRNDTTIIIRYIIVFSRNMTRKNLPERQ